MIGKPGWDEGGRVLNVHVYKSVSFSSFESISFTLHDLNM